MQATPQPGLMQQSQSNAAAHVGHVHEPDVVGTDTTPKSPKPFPMSAEASAFVVKNLDLRWSAATAIFFVTNLTIPGHVPPSADMMKKEFDKEKRRVATRLRNARLAAAKLAAANAALLLEEPDAESGRASGDAAAVGDAAATASVSTAVGAANARPLNPAGPAVPIPRGLAAARSAIALQQAAAAPLLQPQDLPSVEEAEQLRKLAADMYSTFCIDRTRFLEAFVTFTTKWAGANSFVSIQSPHGPLFWEDSRGPDFLQPSVWKFLTAAMVQARALGRELQINPPVGVQQAQEPVTVAKEPAGGPKCELFG